MLEKILNKNLICFILFFFLVSCSSVPKHTSNACKIFGEKYLWYKHSKNSSETYGAPIHIILAFVNKDHLFYEGLKLEIMYLTAVLQHVNNQTEANLETTKLYELIQNNDKISSPLKQRVKIIHEFQKYK